MALVLCACFIAWGTAEGMMKASVRVSNTKAPERYFEEQFWVDTGALYSFAPEDRLECIGVEPTATRKLVLADGREQTRLLGFCDLRIEELGDTVPCPVVFAPRGSLFLLGATALENFGVEVDPVQKRLKPILAVIGGFLASASAALSVGRQEDAQGRRVRARDKMTLEVA